MQAPPHVRLPHPRRWQPVDTRPWLRYTVSGTTRAPLSAQRTSTNLPCRRWVTRVERQEICGRAEEPHATATAAPAAATVTVGVTGAVVITAAKRHTQPQPKRTPQCAHEQSLKVGRNGPILSRGPAINSTRQGTCELACVHACVAASAPVPHGTTYPSAAGVANIWCASVSYTFCTVCNRTRRADMALASSCAWCDNSARRRPLSAS